MVQQTNDDPRAKRRSGIGALLFGAAVGILILIVNTRAILQHRLVRSGWRHGHHLTSPWMVMPVGLFMLVMCLWALWKTVREK